MFSVPTGGTSCAAPAVSTKLIDPPDSTISVPVSPSASPSTSPAGLATEPLTVATPPLLMRPTSSNSASGESPSLQLEPVLQSPAPPTQK